MSSEVEAGHFCGNCDSHNCYEYPLKVFCSTRYGEGKGPVVDTLWCCDEWSLVSQDCYCVREAKKAIRDKKAPK